MNNREYYGKFSSEVSCKAFLKEMRESQGITCKRCIVNTEHFWLAGEQKWQCKTCKSRTNLTAGTIMHKSKTPLKVWFEIIHLMTSVKTPPSACEVQRQMGTKHHSTVWAIMHKVRSMMGEREKRYQLTGPIETDEGFFDIVRYHNSTDENGDKVKRDKDDNIVIPSEDIKRGRGSLGTRPVMVMVQSRPTNQEKPHKKNRIMGYAKMIAMDNMQWKNVKPEFSKAVSKNASVISDDYNSYSRLKTIVKEHKPMVVKPKEAMQKLPWTHTLISNAKTALRVFHSVNDKYLQNYLSEFCYKLNRRTFTGRDSFIGMMQVVIKAPQFRYKETVLAA